MKEIQALIDNRKYSRALSYSLHAYIDSWLKYCKYTSYTLSSEECFLINNFVGKLSQKEIDLSLHSIFLRLKKYAKKNGIADHLENITKRYWIESNDSETAFDELVESDWII